MWQRFKNLFASGSIEHSNAELARIMTDAHKQYMTASKTLSDQMTKQQADMGDALKYITTLKGPAQ